MRLNAQRLHASLCTWGVPPMAEPFRPANSSTRPALDTTCIRDFWAADNTHHGLVWKACLFRTHDRLLPVGIKSPWRGAPTYRHATTIRRVDLKTRRSTSSSPRTRGIYREKGASEHPTREISETREIYETREISEHLTREVSSENPVQNIYRN